MTPTAIFLILIHLIHIHQGEKILGKIAAKIAGVNQPKDNKSIPSKRFISATYCLTGILNNMDRNVDPCKDFYQYACGGWEKRNHIENSDVPLFPFKKVRDENKRQLKEILESMEIKSNYSDVSIPRLEAQNNIQHELEQTTTTTTTKATKTATTTKTATKTIITTSKTTKTTTRTTKTATKITTGNNKQQQ